METESIAIFIPIVTVISAVIMVIYLRRFTNQERLSMIEKGMNPADAQNEVKKTPSSLSLRFSLLSIDIGMGLLIGYFLDYAFRMEAAGYFSMIFIFGGIGMGLSYLIEEKKFNQQH